MSRVQELKEEIYASTLPPDYEVQLRIQETFAEITIASKNGERELRDELARDCAIYKNIYADMDIREWVNL